MQKAQKVIQNKIQNISDAKFTKENVHFDK